MFPHRFSVQHRIETLNGIVENDEIVVTVSSPNGQHTVDTIVIKKYDVAGLIKAIQPFA